MCCTDAGGTRSILTITGEGNRLAKAVPLIMGDEVEKADIEICKDPNGDGDWLLGRGASGVVSWLAYACHAVLDRPCCVFCPHVLLNPWANMVFWVPH